MSCSGPRSLYQAKMGGATKNIRVGRGLDMIVVRARPRISRLLLPELLVLVHPDNDDDDDVRLCVCVFVWVQ